MAGTREGALKAWDKRGRKRPIDYGGEAIKLWNTRALQGQGSNPEQVRHDIWGRERFGGPDRPRTIKGNTSGFSKQQLEDIADLAGAPPGSEVTIEGSNFSLVVDVVFPPTRYGNDESAGRAIRRIELHDKTIYNADFEIAREDRGKGLGLATLELQIETAARLGFREIQVAAVGRPGGSNGYYTWARMGFESDDDDDPIGPYGIKEKLSAIMMRPGGAEWWKKNGKSFSGHFSLEPDSVSMRMFREYQKLKRRQVEALP